MTEPSLQNTPAAPSHPRAQLQYQVRFDWGYDGALALVDADVLVWADQLGRSAEAPSRALHATIDSAVTVAQRVLELQAERGDRVSVGVVAAAAGSSHFAVDDFLAAGAVIDALSRLGLDHCSPEAAAPGAAYSVLRNASRHLVSASVSSRILRESSDRD